MNPVNATALYVSASRAVFQCDPRSPHTFREMYKLLPFFRQSLACLVCGKLLQDPIAPTHSECQHYVCSGCKGQKMQMKPLCSWCRDYSCFQENQQLSLLVQCYRKLCLYVRQSPLLQPISSQADGSPELLALLEEAVLASDVEATEADAEETGPVDTVPSPCAAESLAPIEAPPIPADLSAHPQSSSSYPPCPAAQLECNRTGLEELGPSSPELEVWQAPKPSVPESSASESSAPESLVPKSSAPESIVPESLVPESLVPESLVPESLVPESSVPESSVPESSVPKSLVPESLVPESLVPKSSVPKSLVPESSVPKSCAPKQASICSLLDKRSSRDLEEGEVLLLSVEEPPYKKPVEKKGCKCGRATQNPSVLTCRGQRCPCYSNRKACLDCICRGCQNSYMANGEKKLEAFAVPEKALEQTRLTLGINLTSITAAAALRNTATATAIHGSRAHLLNVATATVSPVAAAFLAPGPQQDPAFEESLELLIG
ncbi:hypothetical protein NHX12_019732 [Muraenolepis orangiensis]|uniref:E3 ubiquitin-protein ligase MSL2 n=1 Tax=Muraenolepis orangiensis TaxID=630683 RepID=A0A9Q0IXH2_9TELE|nr:hypothetical protein NHX12_019732 [Muraenolepis orangiensis]